MSLRDCRGGRGRGIRRASGRRRHGRRCVVPNAKSAKVGLSPDARAHERVPSRASPVSRSSCPALPPRPSPLARWSRAGRLAHSQRSRPVPLGHTTAADRSPRHSRMDHSADAPGPKDGLRSGGAGVRDERKKRSGPVCGSADSEGVSERPKSTAADRKVNRPDRKYPHNCAAPLDFRTVSCSRTQAACHARTETAPAHGRAGVRHPLGGSLQLRWQFRSEPGGWRRGLRPLRRPPCDGYRRTCGGSA